MASALDRLLERIQAALYPLTAFGGTLVVGLVGFVVLADVGVVEAAFWLLDPTSIELYFIEHEGPARATKAFAIAVFSALVLTSLWLGETVVDTAFGGQVREELKNMQQRRAIDNATDHVVVCGYGTFGRTLTARLLEAGRTVVVVESETAVGESVPEEALVVEGDARREATLREAGVERASAIVAAIDDSNANVQIAVIASQLAPQQELIVRVGAEGYESVARRAGADAVVVPEVVSANEVVDDL